MDFLSVGQSTFMVEMLETANILNNATPRSLILLDEIGRGTSTFDGLSIAWAVAEYLHETGDVRAKTLFATHYHELTELALTLQRIKNYHVAVKEWKDEIVFLRKIVAGPSDQSYGIHVAKLAGIPGDVVVPGRGRSCSTWKSRSSTRPASPGSSLPGRPRSATRNQMLALRRGPGAGIIVREIKEELASRAMSRPSPPSTRSESLRRLVGEAASIAVRFVLGFGFLALFFLFFLVIFFEFVVLFVGSFAVLFLALLDRRLEFVLVLVAAQVVGRDRCRRARDNRPRSGRRRTCCGRSAGCRRFRRFPLSS